MTDVTDAWFGFVSGLVMGAPIAIIVLVVRHLHIQRQEQQEMQRLVDESRASKDQFDPS